VRFSHASSPVTDAIRADQAARALEEGVPSRVTPGHPVTVVEVQLCAPHSSTEVGVRRLRPLWRVVGNKWRRLAGRR
jgi:hypothetical protein